MTPENFTYWLQGFFELAETKQLSEKQTEVIRQHLALVLTNVTVNIEHSLVIDEPVRKQLEKFRSTRRRDTRYC